MLDIITRFALSFSLEDYFPRRVPESRLPHVFQPGENTQYGMIERNHCGLPYASGMPSGFSYTCCIPGSVQTSDGKLRDAITLEELNNQQMLERLKEYDKYNYFVSGVGDHYVKIIEVKRYYPWWRRFCKHLF